MDPKRLAEIDALFAAALELRPGARSGFLAERCGADAELRREVEALLAHSGERVEELVFPVRAFGARAAAAGELEPGAALGAWRIVAPLGRGGMGAVWLAERAGPGFVQRGALKVLPAAATASPQAVARFELERRILARLAHPHIAHLLDGGVDARGLPFLVLELVEGRPLDAWCDERGAGIDDRLRLLIEVARAVAAAHRSLVVHRDLKPSNVMVTAEGEVKLLDFGIAKLLDPESGDPALTAVEARPMTPAFASPEQVRGEPITTASDVYQLGLLLYELLTGRRAQQATSGSLAELVKVVCETEPPPPSRAVAAPGGERSAAERAALRHATPARLARRYRGDLDAVVAHALAKDPARRYGSAEELAADLERLLDGRPVRARRPTVAYRAGKFLRRHRAASIAAGLALALTVAYAVGVTLQARALERQRQRAEIEATKAAEVERFLVGLFESSDPGVARGHEATARELLERGVERSGRDLAGQPEVQARLWSTLGEIHGALDLVGAGRALVERALEQQRRLHGDRDPEVAASWHRLGVLQRLGDDPAAAVASLERAAALRRELLDADSPELAETLTALGEARRRSGDLAGAEAAYRESLAIRERRSDRAGIAASFASLGALRHSERDYAGAEAFHRRALELHLALYGTDHPDTAISRLNLGMALRRQDEVEAAIPLLEAALATHRAVYGAEHFTTAWTQVELAMAFQQQGALERAEAQLEEVYPRLVAKLGADDARVADVAVGFGQLRVRQGRPAEGEPLLRAALAALAARYGAPHYRLGAAALWLGRSLAAQGRHEEAAAAWRAGLAGMRPEIDAKLIGDLERELAAAR